MLFLLEHIERALHATGIDDRVQAGHEAIDIGGDCLLSFAGKPRVGALPVPRQVAGRTEAVRPPGVLVEPAAGEESVRQYSTSEIGAEQAGTREVRAGEVGARERGTPEVAAGKIGAIHLARRKVG